MTRTQKIERIKQLLPPWEIDETVSWDEVPEEELDRILEEVDG